MRCSFFTKHALCNKHSVANTSQLNVEVEAVPQKQQPVLLLMICFFDWKQFGALDGLCYFCQYMAEHCKMNKVFRYWVPEALQSEVTLIL